MANLVIFALSYSPHYLGGSGAIEPLRVWSEHFILEPDQPYLWQFVSYAFLHGGYAHILGNMFFLYLFGNNVNDKMGHTAYLCFYLAGAVFSGIGHSLLHNTPVLGASGAVAAVTGAYLVFFPQTLITVLYWFFFVGTLELPAFYFIGFKMIFLDNVISRYTPMVAYDAHLSGYTFGIGMSVALLAMGLTGTSGLDVWSLFRQWNRRRHYRDVVSAGYDPFSGERPRKHIEIREVQKTSKEDEDEEKIIVLRAAISELINQGNFASASEKYLALIQIDAEQLLPRQYLLDVANQLMSDGRWPEAAVAYEQFLAHYKSYEYSEQVELMLGIIYSRYLKRPEEAVKHLRTAKEKLSDAGQRKMCEEELAKLL